MARLPGLSHLRELRSDGTDVTYVTNGNGLSAKRSLPEPKTANRKRQTANHKPVVDLHPHLPLQPIQHEDLDKSGWSKSRYLHD